MPKPRVAAGFYLWKSPATGYLQGRRQSVMSDPFDPEESWEGGRSIYPSAQSCANTMSIHQRLLDLHEATLDYRWLQWLSTKAQKSKKAKALLVKVQQAIPEDWQQAESLTSEDLLAMRQKIVQFAMKKSAR